MLRPLVLGAMFVSMALAGCLGGDDLPQEEQRQMPPTDSERAVVPPELRDSLTQPDFEIKGHYEHTFLATTGTQLYVDYFLPDVPDDVKAPVILVFTPYQSAETGEANGSLGDDPAYRGPLVDYYVPRGYAVAFADVRGNHRAGGCIDQTGPEQWQDGYDYVEWLGTQEWSNGRVGMWGASYDAETQFTTAMMQPPHLVTIVPVASVSNQYEWSFYQGVPYSGQPTAGMASYFSGSAAPSSNPDDAAKYPEKLECQPEAMGAGADYSGDHSAFWKERDYRSMAGQINASVLHIHGLADWNVRPVHIDPLFNDITSVKRGMFGQWTHQFPLREDWQTIENAWYDFWLMGRETGILDILPPVLIQDGTGQWWGIDEFPPRDPQWRALELSADGSLVAPGQSTAGQATIQDRPNGEAAPVGAATSATWEVVVDEELRLVGRPYVSFQAQTSEASTHWVARLEVAEDAQCQLPDNRSQSICENHGYQDTRHRNGMDDPQDLTPGETYDLTITMYPQYDVIPAGSTLRLTLTNSDPDITQDTTNAINTIFLGGDEAAAIYLPLDPGGVALPADELPDIFPGYES